MKDLEAWLDSRIGLNFRSGLARMEQAMVLLKRPDKSYPIIHVTGTNGKGSTIAFLSGLFQAHGKKVGTFTSPHIESIHDRICLNGQPISDEVFVSMARQIQAMEQQLVETHDQLSYFEILTLIAFLYFAEQQVDVALIEVGIGGLLDTTNVITGEIAVVTSVGLDHQETLGDSIEKIAEQKAGIFKAQKAAVIGPLPSAAQQICQQKSGQLGTSIYVCGEDFDLANGRFWNQDVSWEGLRLGLLGTHQEENAAVALEAFFLFMKEQSWPVSDRQIFEALAATQWPGRLELFDGGIYLDGAHNQPAIKGLVDFMKLQHAKEITILFGALKRKDYTAMLTYLRDELPDAQLFVTTFSDSGAVGAEEIGDFPYVADYQDFIEIYLQEKSSKQLLFVTGSLYFISQVRAYIKNR